MTSSFQPIDLDSLADAVAARLAGRSPIGPGTPRSIPAVPLPDLHIGASLRIAGVEFTQSIQHHGAAGVSYGADNSVPLVAYKTLVARTYPYVRQGRFGGHTLSGQRVTGELTLSIGERVIYRTGPTRAEGARLGRSSQLERGLWDRDFMLAGGDSRFATSLVPINSSLNFVVPAYYCRAGRVHAAIRLWPVAEGPSAGQTPTDSQFLQFIDVQAPKVCLVRVNWTDAAGNVTRPGDAAMLATLGVASRMLPFPYFETTILAIELTRSGNFAMLPAKAGDCNALWSELVRQLNLTRIFTTLFQLGDIVYGMVPTAAIPAGANPINSGCGRGAGAGFVGLQTTFAHEVGHLYERDHVAVTGDEHNDPNYPNYGGSRRSIGEVGIDTGTSPPTLFDPAGNDDIMSYGTNQWISPYTYRGILDARGLHQSAPVRPGRLRPLLILDLRVYREVRGERQVEIRRAARIVAPGPPPPLPAVAVSPVSIDLMDSTGGILATHHCAWIPPHAGGQGEWGCRCGTRVPLGREPWLDLQEAIELPEEDLAGLAFHDGGDPFFTIEVGEPPQVWIEGPELREERLVLRVGADHPRERPSVVVLFSADDGLSWWPVAYDPPDGEVEIPADHLPGGSWGRLRAIATAELLSAEADTEPFERPAVSRRLHLHLPEGHCPTAEGPVALAAAIDTRGLGPVAPAEVRWSSSLDGELGFGYGLTPTLRQGEHEVTVTAPDGLGGWLSERGIIIVGGRTDQPS